MARLVEVGTCGNGRQLLAENMLRFGHDARPVPSGRPARAAGGVVSQSHVAITRCYSASGSIVKTFLLVLIRLDTYENYRLYLQERGEWSHHRPGTRQAPATRSCSPLPSRHPPTPHAPQPLAHTTPTPPHP